MRATTAILCDYASTRDSTLTIVGGGISQMMQPTYPGPLAVMIALAIEIADADFGRRHSVRVAVRSQDGRLIGDVKGGFVLGPAESTELPTGLRASVPMAVPLGLIMLPSPGVYEVGVFLNGRKSTTLGISAVQSSTETDSREAKQSN